MAEDPQKILRNLLERATVKILSGDTFKGTGFFISPCHLLTAYHCIKHADESHIYIKNQVYGRLRVILEKEKSFPNPEIDIAVLTLAPEALVKVDDYLPLGFITESNATDAILAVGYPAEIFSFLEGRIHGFPEKYPHQFFNNAMKAEGQSGGLVYHLATQRVVGLALSGYKPEVLRDGGLAGRFEMLFRHWSELETLNQQAIAHWEQRLSGKQPPPLSPAEPLPPNPYKGLAAFEETDAALFFGRDDDIADLLTAIEHQPLVLIVGNSGSGKSSLVFAGLIPKLRSSPHWVIAACRPRNYPLLAMRNALLPFLPPTLRGSVNQLSLVDLIQQVLQQRNGQRLLFIVDQFEELFTANEPAIQQELLNQLLAAVTTFTPLREAGKQVVPLVLVLTLRADFLSHALSDSSLAKALDRYPKKLLGPVTDEIQLRRIIVEPAQQLGVSLEPQLTERILQEVTQQAVSLPLLEFALAQLWEQQRTGRQLTHQAYHATGGVVQALSQHADTVYARFTAEEQEQLRHIFVQLVRPGEGTEDTRQVATRTQVPHWETLVKQLADARLVVTSQQEATGQETVEVVHEALIRHWQPLRDWMKADRTFRLWQNGLREAMKSWQAAATDEGALLRGVRLLEAEEKVQQYGEQVALEEREFVAASVALRKREQQRQRRNRRLAITAMVMIGVMLAGGLWREVVQGKKLEQSFQLVTEERNQAEKQRNLAEQAKSEATKNLSQAQKTQSLFLVDLSQQQTQAGNAVNGMLLALEALPKDLKNPERPYIVQAEDSLYQTLYRPRETHILRHEGSVSYVEFSADGQRVVTASYDNTARLWNATTGELLFTLQGHTDYVYHAVFSADSQRVITASRDKTARLWNATTGELLFTLQGHTSHVNHAAFSANGQRVVTASDDNTARLWNATTGESLFILQGHTEGVKHAAFSADGQRVVTASNDDTARLWNATTGESLFTLQGHTDSVRHAAFSADGQRVITASNDNTARLWNATTGESLFTLQGHTDNVEHAAFSADGQRVITASDDNTARLWNATTGESLFTLQGHTDEVTHAAFSADGQRMVTASWDDTARLWNATTSESLFTLQGHTDEVNHAAFSANGQRVVTASDDGTARLWNTTSGELLFTLGHNNGIFPNNVTHAAFSADGQRVVTASADGTARLWNATTGESLFTLHGHTSSVTHAAFSANGQRVVTASGYPDNTARLWNATTSESLFTLQGHTDIVIHVAFSADGQRVVTASGGIYSDKTARLWNATTGELLFTLQGHTGPVFHAAFSADGQRVVTASDDKTARLWNATTGESLFTLHGHTDNVEHAEFSADGQRVVTASNDNTARLWNATTGESLFTLQGHTSWVNHAAFSADGQRVVTASVDNTARLWNATTGESLFTLQGHTDNVTHAAFSADGQRVVTASNDGTAKIWKIFTTQALIDYARSQVPRQLTKEQRKQFFLE